MSNFSSFIVCKIRHFLHFLQIFFAKNGHVVAIFLIFNTFLSFLTNFGTSEIILHAGLLAPKPSVFSGIDYYTFLTPKNCSSIVNLRNFGRNFRMDNGFLKA